MTDRTILIVDDDPVLRRFLGQRLRAEGYTTSAVATGTDALARLQKHPADLVLLDVSMPEMSGYDVLDALRRDERTRRVPVIFLTVRDSREEETRGLREGVVDYLSKDVLAPDRINILLYRLRNFFTWQENERLRGILATIVSANHEINNPLTVILAAAQVLGEVRWPERNADAERLLGRIEEQCLQIKHCLDRISHLNSWASRPYVEGVEMLDLETGQTGPPLQGAGPEKSGITP